MKIKFMGALHASPNKNPEKGITYTGHLKLADLVSAHKNHGKDLYRGNVRETLASTYAQIKKNKVTDGIYRTLEKINSGELDPIVFFNGHQGCLIMCESLSISDGEYVAEIKHDYQGIGNGQQSVNAAYFFSNRNEISDDIIIQAKVMVGYSKKDFQESCNRNNTSNRISQKSVISNDWTDISNELKSMGITLIYKTGGVKPKRSAGRIINIQEKNYYNFLNAYFVKTPWITGDETIRQGFSVDSVTVSELIKLDNFKTQLVNWFDNNLKNYDTDLFDYKRIGYIQNSIVTAFKQYYDGNLSESDFIKICFDKTIYPAIKREGRRVDCSYFTNETNVKNILDNIESKLTIYKMEQKQLQTV